MTDTPETPGAPEAGSDIETAADAVIDAVTARQQEALETVETASSAMIVGLTSVQREIADFVSERLRQDIEARHDMLRCKTFGEMHVLQTRFIATAVTQYSAEAARLMKLGAATVSRSLDRGA